MPAEWDLYVFSSDIKKQPAFSEFCRRVHPLLHHRRKIQLVYINQQEKVEQCIQEAGYPCLVSKCRNFILIKQELRDWIHKQLKDDTVSQQIYNKLAQEILVQAEKLQVCAVSEHVNKLMEQHTKYKQYHTNNEDNNDNDSSTSDNSSTSDEDGF